MSKFRKAAANTVYPLITIDVDYVSDDKESRVVVQWDHVGPPGQRYKKWPLSGGTLEASQLSDISTTIARMVDEAVVTMLTIRGLPKR